MNQVAQFVREGAEPLVQGPDTFFRQQHLAAIGIFRDRIGDGIVQAAIERAKLVGLNR